MSMTEELNIFLGWPRRDSTSFLGWPRRDCYAPRKYTKDILKKFDYGETKPLWMPMSTTTVLDANEDGESMN
jgi:hypothetical protein